MQQYDAALKSVLTRGSACALSRLMGSEVEKFLPGEFPAVRTLHADLPGEARDGTLIHVELQGTNESGMAWRMLEYCVAIQRQFERFPRQLVMYVGEAPLRMERRIAADGLKFEYRLVDIRELDGEPLLASERLDENMIGILAGMPDGKRAVRRVLAKIAASAPEGRAKAIRELMLIAGLRNLGSIVIEESKRMPITTDIMEHDYLGPLIRNSRAEG